MDVTMPPRKKADAAPQVIDAQTMQEPEVQAREVAPYDSGKPAYATVNIYGPDGDLCGLGAEIPTAWPHDFINELLATGGATQAQGE